jgi:hypothetical protein
MAQVTVVTSSRSTRCTNGRLPSISLLGSLFDLGSEAT